MSRVNKEISTYLRVRNKIGLYKVCELLDFKPHDGQKTYFDIIDSRNFAVLTLNMGRRFGKSVSISRVAVADLIAPYASVILIAPTTANAKVMYNLIYTDVLKIGLEVTNKDTKGMTFTLRNGSRFQVVTGRNYDSARGFHFSLAIFEEYTYIDNLAEIVDNVIGPAMADYGTDPETGLPNGKMLFIGTPTSKGTDAWKIFIKGVEGSPYKQPGYISLTLPTRANPYISESFLEQVKSKLDAVAYKREYEAEWTDMDESKVYYSFSIDENVIPYEEALKKLNSSVKFISGHDLGFRDNTAMTLAFIEPYTGDIIIIGEYKANQLPLSAHIKAFKDLESQYNVTNISRYCDPSNVQAMADAASDFGYIMQPADNAIQEGVQTINNLFHHKKLWIASNCVETIKEIEELYWVSEVSKTVKRTDGGHADLSIAAMRYMVHTWIKLQEQDIIVL